MNWNKIVENLTGGSMSETEPRLFTLRNLYSSVETPWIVEKEKDRNNTRPKRKLPGDDSRMDIPEAVT